MDWLKAASVVALGMMTAILTGAAKALATSAIARTARYEQRLSLICSPPDWRIRRRPTPPPRKPDSMPASSRPARRAC